MIYILGLNYTRKQWTKEDDALVALWKAKMNQKKYKEADLIRKKLIKMKII
jgi:cysteinyl-tRNA synthetase